MGPRKHLGKLKGHAGVCQGLLNMMEQPPQGVPKHGAAGTVCGTRGSADLLSPARDAGPALPGR